VALVRGVACLGWLMDGVEKGKERGLCKSVNGMQKKGDQ